MVKKCLNIKGKKRIVIVFFLFEKNEIICKEK
jgi:hypothetical protein